MLQFIFLNLRRAGTCLFSSFLYLDILPLALLLDQTVANAVIQPATTNLFNREYEVNQNIPAAGPSVMLSAKWRF